MKTKTDLNQHLLIDNKAIESLIGAAKIKETDVVLEIGPGTGNITRPLANMAKKVIAVEIDSNFKEDLEKMPENVTVVFTDVLDYLKENPASFNKIVSNLPFNLCEPLMHYLIKAENVELSALITPVSFAKKAKVHPVFPSFLKINEIKSVPAKSFDPAPRVDSEIITVTKEEKITPEINQILYEQRDKKLKNALLSMLTVSKTKKEAKEKIKALKLPASVLEKKVAVLSAENYKKIGELFK